MKNKIITTEIRKEDICDNKLLVTFKYQKNFTILCNEEMVLNIKNGMIKYDTYFEKSKETALIKPTHKKINNKKFNLEFIDVILEFDKPYILLINNNEESEIYCMYARKGINDGVLCFESIDNFDYFLKEQYFDKDEIDEYLKTKRVYFNGKLKENTLFDDIKPSFYEYDLSTEADRVFIALANVFFKPNKNIEKPLINNLVLFDEVNNIFNVTINKSNNKYILIEKKYNFELPIIETIDLLKGKQKKSFDNISTYVFDEKVHANKTKIKRF
ncbi:MAG: hypothetical protein PUD59_03090 [bacterium]|nr:hypothetical protein [bacterium]